MEKEKKIIDKFLKLAPGGVYGISSVLIRIFGDFLAYLYFPGYNMLDNMVSDLGVGPGWLFFSLGLIFSGIVSVPFYVSFARSLQNEVVNEKMLKAALTFYYISNATYILIGFFPSCENIPLIYTAHGFLAVISWVTGLTYLILFSKLMIHDSKYSRLAAYSGFILIIFIILFLITWYPLFEWIMEFAWMTWILYISSYTIYHELC
jgi:hypothetical membrane protein